MKRIVLAVGMLGLVISASGASRSMSESKESKERSAKDLQSMALDDRLDAIAADSGAKRVLKPWTYAFFDMSIAGRSLAERLTNEIQATVNRAAAEECENVIVGCCVMRDNQLKPDSWRIQNLDNPLDSFPRIGSGDLLMVGCVAHGEVTIYYFLGGKEAEAYRENNRRNAHCSYDQMFLIQRISDHAAQSNERYVFSAEEERVFEVLPESMRLILSLQLPEIQNQQAVSAVSSSSVSSRSASAISSQSSSSVAQASLSASAQSASVVSSQNRVAANQQQVEEVAKIAAAQRVQNNAETFVVSDVPQITMTPLLAPREVIAEQNTLVPQIQPQREAQAQQPGQQQVPRVEQQQGKWGWGKTALAAGAGTIAVVGVGAGVGVAVLGAAAAKAAAIKAGCYLAPHAMRYLGLAAMKPWWYLGL